jgi:type I restriction enzyme S subunit
MAGGIKMGEIEINRTVPFIYFIEPEISESGSGSTFSAISKSQINNLKIPLPPMDEQHRIASRLQELMQEIERARTAVEKQIEAINALPQAILRKAFKGEL